MVKLALQIKATLECINRLYTCHPHYQWFLRVKCGSCGEVGEKWIDITESEKVPLKHGRSDTHFLAKCKLCSRENSFDIIEGSNGEYLAADSGKFKTIVVFECRGIEPIEFWPKAGWKVESEESGVKFDEVDLTEKEWVDYDEKNNVSVGIYDFESKIIKIK